MLSPLVGSTPLTGRIIRHKIRQNGNDIEKQQNDASNTVIEALSHKPLDGMQKDLLYSVISYLTIALRSRYTGDVNDKDSKFFNQTVDKRSNSLQITQEGLAKELTYWKICNETESNELAINLLCICTHAHTSRSFVKSYTDAGNKVLKALKIKKDKNLMGDIKYYLENGRDLKLKFTVRDPMSPLAYGYNPVRNYVVMRTKNTMIRLFGNNIANAKLQDLNCLNGLNFEGLNLTNNKSFINIKKINSYTNTNGAQLPNYLIRILDEQKQMLGVNYVFRNNEPVKDYQTYLEFYKKQYDYYESYITHGWNLGSYSTYFCFELFGLC